MSVQQWHKSEGSSKDEINEAIEKEKEGKKCRKIEI
jgi:hypothetical protein